MTVDKILSEILGFCKYKVDNHLCTMEEMNSVVSAIENNMEIGATIGDLADFYGKSKDAVNGVINRKFIGKPRRNVVLYPFHRFRKIVPTSWRKSG